MRRVSLLLLFLLTAVTAFGDNWNQGGGSTGGGTCGSLGGDLSGSCTTAVVAKLNGNSPGAIPESYIQNLPTDLANLANLIGTGTQPGSPGTYTVAGCGVAWSGSGYIYNVSACSYYIGGTLYSASAATVTLTAADATNDRFDAIIANTSSAITKIDGTAAANPAIPTNDPSTQLPITYVLVTHNTSNPVSASNESVYLENTEWTCTAGTGSACADTGNPRTGTKDIKFTAVSANAFLKLVRSSTLSLDTYQQLNMWIAPVTWNNSRSVQLTLRDANAVQVGNTVTISNGSFGLSTSSTSYQLLAIPLAQFAVPAGTSIKELRINPAGSGGTFTFYIDDVVIQTTTNTVVPGAAYATMYRSPSGQLAATGPGTSGYILQSTGVAGPPAFTIKDAAEWDMPLAGCQNTTAFLLWNSPVSNPGAAVCATGTNTQDGYATFDASTDQFLQITARLPASYNGGAIGATVGWKAAAITGAAGLCVQMVCTPTGATDDPAFPAQSSGNCVSSTVAGTTLQMTDATIPSYIPTNCAASRRIHIQFSRDANGGAVTDDMAGNALVYDVRLSIPR